MSFTTSFANLAVPPFILYGSAVVVGYMIGLSTVSLYMQRKTLENLMLIKGDTTRMRKVLRTARTLMTIMFIVSTFAFIALTIFYIYILGLTQSFLLFLLVGCSTAAIFFAFPIVGTRTLNHRKRK